MPRLCPREKTARARQLPALLRRERELQQAKRRCSSIASHLLAPPLGVGRYGDLMPDPRQHLIPALWHVGTHCPDLNERRAVESQTMRVQSGRQMQGDVACVGDQARKKGGHGPPFSSNETPTDADDSGLATAHGAEGQQAEAHEGE